MIKIIQGELYRIRKSRLFFVSISLSTFFMLAFATTFRYYTIRIPVETGSEIFVSMNKFTEFLFSDYSLILPITVFLVLYFTEDYTKGLHEILFSKGISRNHFFFGKLITSWIVVIFYIVFNILMAYFLFISMIVKQYHIDCSITTIIGYLLLQILCFIGYSCFLWLLSCMFRIRTLVLIISFILLGTLYLYLTKISVALDLSYSLYQYWIVGLSHKMAIDLYYKQLPVILMTAVLYILLPIIITFFIYKNADLRRLERR